MTIRLIILALGLLYVVGAVIYGCLTPVRLDGEDK